MLLFRVEDNCTSGGKRGREKPTDDEITLPRNWDLFSVKYVTANWLQLGC